MPLDLGRIQGICFDVDGTLSDTDNQWVTRVERLLLPWSRLFPQREVYPFARRLVMEMVTPGNLAYELLDRLHLDDEAGRLLSALSRLKKDCPGHFLLIPGVVEMLADVQQRYQLSIVSARGERSTRAFIEQFELDQYFLAVATALTCTHTKPFADPILWAAERMGIPASACLMVGDTTVDIRAGKAAGAQTAGVLCGFGTQRELLRAGADLIIDSTVDLAAILGGG